jgi:hypothetical protein
MVKLNLTNRQVLLISMALKYMYDDVEVYVEDFSMLRSIEELAELIQGETSKELEKLRTQ